MNRWLRRLLLRRAARHLGKALLEAALAERESSRRMGRDAAARKRAQRETPPEQPGNRLHEQHASPVGLEGKTENRKSPSNEQPDRWVTLQTG